MEDREEEAEEKDDKEEQYAMEGQSQRRTRDGPTKASVQAHCATMWLLRGGTGRLPTMQVCGLSTALLSKRSLRSLGQG